MAPNHLSLKSLQHKRGQTLVEYALILAFISVVAIGTLISMGSQVKGTFSSVNSQLATAKVGGPSASNGQAQGGG